MKAPSWLAALVLGATAVIAGPAASQSYPTKPIRLVVGWPAGGGADIVARLVAQGLTEQLRQQVVVENRPGASGNIGAETVAKAVPDGYTILLVGANHATNVHLYKKINYHPVNDFEPIALLTAAPNILVANPALPARTLPELIAMAKARPGQVAYGSAGNGTTGHLAMELLKSITGADMVHVPYKGGNPFMTDLIGGQVMVGFENVLSAGPHIQAGKLRAIASSGQRRSPVLPNVPTVAEAGYPGFDVVLWQGLLAPAGTPREVIARLSSAVQASLKNPQVLNRFNELAVGAIGGTPDEFRAFLARETDQWGKVIKTSGIQLD